VNPGPSRLRRAVTLLVALVLIGALYLLSQLPALPSPEAEAIAARFRFEKLPFPEPAGFRHKTVRQVHPSLWGPRPSALLPDLQTSLFRPGFMTVTAAAGHTGQADTHNGCESQPGVSGKSNGPSHRKLSPSWRQDRPCSCESEQALVALKQVSRTPVSSVFWGFLRSCRQRVDLMKTTQNTGFSAISR
jgi:hypothetical protein